MCGILGFIGGEKNIGANILDSMERIAHRGPDARGIYRDELAALAHLRLSIIDLTDSANQPMQSHCGRFVMVYNGEIYNFKEILQQIIAEKPGFVPRTQSDTEIILEAFAIWNSAFVQKLNGMFAIAIWDKLEKKLFLFRDRIGIKPIYYFHNNNIFAFASELKALKEDQQIRKNLSVDYRAVNAFLHLGYIPAPLSIYNEIKKFPAGHWGEFKDGKFILHPYWTPEKKVNPDRYEKTTEEYLDELQELIISSVRYRLIADVPYGTFLSGGIDSSIVTAVAQGLNPHPINTFNIGFWDKDYDESGYARKVAEHLGTKHQSMQVSEADALEWMPRLSDIYDEPYADSSAIPTLLVSKMARQHVTMTLSGDGGDELFHGYGSYRWANRLSHPLLPMVQGAANKLLKLGPMKYRRAAGLFDKVHSQMLKSHIFSQEQYLFSRSDTRGFLKKDFYEEFELDENFGAHLAFLNPAEQQALFDLKYYLPDDLLVKVDRASMYFALETRVPLLDYRIVEWALNLPQKLKIKDGQSKWLLKQLLYRYVPASLFDRPKRGFAIPLQKWLKADLKDFAMDYLNEQSIRNMGILEPDMVKGLLNSFYTKNHHYQYNKIWQILVLQKWLIENRI